ncbi:MAG: TonB-dependent receptor [Caulobacteraceae bacterium]|nr:TonB-dependent receptor [Caulobacteraceae bacterium]
MPAISNRCTRLLCGTAFCVAGLTGAATARAATAADAAQPATEVETLVVTAQKRSENIQDVPISIQAFSARDIDALGIKSSIDLGAVTPNVDIALVAGPGNQPIITIRGIGLNDYDTNNAGPNGVYVDEVYLSAPSSQSFQTFDLNRIEVLKGPQGTLYGRNTSGGAINFITNKPTDEFTARLHAEYSSFNTFNFEGAVSGPLTPGLDGRVAFVKNNSSGFMHNDLTGNDENGTDNYAVRAMLQAKPTSNLTLLFNLHGGQVDNRPTEYRHYGDLDPATFAQCSVTDTYAGKCIDLFGYGTPSGFYHGAFNRQEHLKVNNLGGSARADWNLGSITLTSLSAFEHNDKLHPEDSDASPNRLLEINFGVRSNTFTQELRATQATEKYNWVVGAYYLHEDLKQNQPIFILLDGDKFFGGPGAADGVAFQAFDRSDQTTDAYAVFGQGDYALTDRLKLTLGGRYTREERGFTYDGSVQFQEGGMDHFGPLIPLANVRESLTDSAFSWRAAIDYRLARSVLAYASVSTGFKSGGFNGSFLSLVPAEIALQLKPIGPEHVTSYEVGLKSSLFDNRLVFDAAAFYNAYRDLQVFTLVPPPEGGTGLPVNVLDNAPKAHTQGIEAQIVARPFPALTASAQVGLLDTKLDQFVANRDPNQPDFSGNQLPNAPRFSAAGLVDYRVPVGQGTLDLQFSATYKSHQFFDTANDPYITQGGYWLENARVAYSTPGSHWEVAGYVRNLSNRKYLIDAFDLSFLGFIQGIVGTPRTFGVEVNYRY